MVAPSTGSATPEIVRASSEAKNTAALAMSTGSGMRPSGIDSRKRAFSLLGVVGHAAKKGHQHRRIGGPGADGVDADVLGRKLQREAAHQPNDAVLGRGVGREVGPRHDRLQGRGEQNDRAFRALLRPPSERG